MSRPYGKIAVDTDNSKFMRLIKKVNNYTPDIAPLLINLTIYIDINFPELKRGTGDYYINYYYQNTKKVFCKLDTKQIPEYKNALYISIYKEDYKLLPSEVKNNFVYEKPNSEFFKHGSFPYQAIIKDVSDLELAHKLLKELYNIGVKSL